MGIETWCHPPHHSSTLTLRSPNHVLRLPIVNSIHAISCIKLPHDSFGPSLWLKRFPLFSPGLHSYVQRICGVELDPSRGSEGHPFLGQLVLYVASVIYINRYLTWFSWQIFVAIVLLLRWSENVEFKDPYINFFDLFAGASNLSKVWQET